MKPSINRLAIVSGSRADWSLWLPLLAEFNNHPEFEILLVTTGSHYHSLQNHSLQNIIAAGYSPKAEVIILPKTTTPDDISVATGKGIQEFTKVWMQLNPTAILVLGDRYEMFAAATSAYFLNIPLIHLYGGETTAGAWDEGLRHAISHFSQLHFTAAEAYRQRLIQMGQHPNRIFTVGSLGIDAQKMVDIPSRNSLLKWLELPNQTEFLLITFHPVTKKKDGGIRELKVLLEALIDQKEHLIFTSPHPDAGGEKIQKIIEDFCFNRQDSTKIILNAGNIWYPALLKYAKAILGNSSSGIIEASNFHTPVLNWGIRQSGRIIPDNVISCTGSKKILLNNINKLLSEDFKQFCKKTNNPWGDGNSAKKIIHILKTQIPFKFEPLPFYDLPQT